MKGNEFAERCLQSSFRTRKGDLRRGWAGSTIGFKGRGVKCWLRS